MVMIKLKNKNQPQILGLLLKSQPLPKMEVGMAHQTSKKRLKIKLHKIPGQISLHLRCNQSMNGLLKNSQVKTKEDGVVAQMKVKPQSSLQHLTLGLMSNQSNKILVEVAGTINSNQQMLKLQEEVVAGIMSNQMRLLPGAAVGIQLKLSQLLQVEGAGTPFKLSQLQSQEVGEMNQLLKKLKSPKKTHLMDYILAFCKFALLKVTET